MNTVYEKITAFSSILTNNNTLKKIECSHNKTFWQYIKADKALEHCWIKLNNTKAINFIVVDVDPAQFNKHKIANAIKVCLPNYIILNEFKQNSVQFGYVLAETVFRKHTKQEEKYQYVRSALNRLFNADENHQNYKAKNPVAGFWQTQWQDNEFYTLNQLYNLLKKHEETELEKAYKALNVYEQDFNVIIEEVKKEEVENLEERKIRKKNENYTYDKNSSNCANFDDLRLKAYEFTETFREVYTSRKDLFNALYNFLENQQNEEIYKHQTGAERKATIRSICNFCCDDYKSTNNSKYTRINQNKRDDEMKRIEQLKTMCDVNKKYTKAERAEFAKKLNVCDKTIKNYLAKARNFNFNEEENQKKKEIEKIIDYKKNKFLSFKEIAKILDKSENTIKTIYYRNS